MAKDQKQDAPPRRRRARALSDEELKLWRVVTRDATPLPGKQHPPEPELSEATPSVAPVVSKAKQKKPVHSVSVTVASSRPAGPPPLSGLDRRTSQKLARGQVETEARLDLHGHGREEARMALLRFVTSCRANGLRCVLVITGKGESPFSRHVLHSARYHQAVDHSGILRSALPVWLEEAAFRAEVASFQPAHPRHGGGGAFYLWLRKRK